MTKSRVDVRDSSRASPNSAMMTSTRPNCGDESDQQEKAVQPANVSLKETWTVIKQLDDQQDQQDAIEADA